AAVVRDGRHIRDVRDLQSAGVERTHRRLAAGTGALDAHLDHLDAMLLSSGAGLLGGNLSRERRALARAAETAAARRRPRQRVALPVGDRHDRVVERGMHVRDRVGHMLLDLLATFARRPLFLLSHMSLYVKRLASSKSTS